MLDAKIASALNKIIQNSPFKKKVSLEEQKAQKEVRSLRGRQIAFMIYDYFRVTGAHDTVLDYADLFSVTLHDDNIQEFDTRWNELLLSMSKIPSDDISESLFKLRIRESAQLKTVLELYDMEIHQKISMPNYQKLKTMVKRSVDQKLRLRNFDARHGRTESGAVVKSRKGLIGVEGGKGTCYQWKENGQCSQGDQCSFHDRVLLGGHPLWRSVHTGAGLAALGLHSLAHGCGDCRWCHDEVHCAQHHRPHGVEFRRPRRALSTFWESSLADVFSVARRSQRCDWPVFSTFA